MSGCHETMRFVISVSVLRLRWRGLELLPRDGGAQVLEVLLDQLLLLLHPLGAADSRADVAELLEVLHRSVAVERGGLRLVLRVGPPVAKSVFFGWLASASSARAARACLRLGGACGADDGHQYVTANVRRRSVPRRAPSRIPGTWKPPQTGSTNSQPCFTTSPPYRFTSRSLHILPAARPRRDPRRQSRANCKSCPSRSRAAAGIYAALEPNALRGLVREPLGNGSRLPAPDRGPVRLEPVGPCSRLRRPGGARGSGNRRDRESFPERRRTRGR